MDKPPNLRFSDGDRDCGNCIAFKKQAQTCSMFNDYPVSGELTCDDWKGDKPHDKDVKDDG